MHGKKKETLMILGLCLLFLLATVGFADAALDAAHGETAAASPQQESVAPAQTSNEETTSNDTREADGQAGGQDVKPTAAPAGAPIADAPSAPAEAPDQGSGENPDMQETPDVPRAPEEAPVETPIPADDDLPETAQTPIPTEVPEIEEPGKVGEKIPDEVGDDETGQGHKDLAVDEDVERAWEEALYEAFVATEGGTLNVRAAASKEAEILAKLANGTRVEVFHEAGDWALIEYEDERGVERGYVKAEFLSIEPPEADEAEALPPVDADEALPEADEAEALPPVDADEALPEADEAEALPSVDADEALPEAGEADGANEPDITLSLSVGGDKLVLGAPVTITAHIEGGLEGAQYAAQWQNDLSGEFADVPGETGLSVSFVADAANIGCGWRVVLTPDAA